MSIYSSEEYKDVVLRKRVIRLWKINVVLKLCSKETLRKCNVSDIEIKQLEVINYKYSSSNILSFIALVFLDKLNSNNFKCYILLSKECGNGGFHGNLKQ